MMVAKLIVMTTNRSGATDVAAHLQPRETCDPRRGNGGAGRRRRLQIPTHEQMLVLGAQFDLREWRRIPQGLCERDRDHIENSRYLEAGRKKRVGQYRINRDGWVPIQLAQRDEQIALRDLEIDLNTLLSLARAGAYRISRLDGETVSLPSIEALADLKLRADGPFAKLTVSPLPAPKIVDWSPSPRLTRVILEMHRKVLRRAAQLGANDDLAHQ
jgi:hypothetical protein